MSQNIYKGIITARCLLFVFQLFMSAILPEIITILVD